MKTVFLPAILVALLAFVSWQRPAPTAAADLVDLDVKNAPLAETLQLLEAKTGQHIVAGQNLRGRITLSVRQQPLDRVLEEIAAQAGAVSMVVMPIYSGDASLRALTQWFQGGGPVAHWEGAARKFSGKKQVLYARDPADPQPVVSMDAVSYPATSVAPIISETSGAHVLLEDNENQKITICLFEETANTAAETLARRLGKQWTRLHVLQSRPEEIVRVQVGQKRLLAGMEWAPGLKFFGTNWLATPKEICERTPKGNVNSDTCG